MAAFPFDKLTDTLLPSAISISPNGAYVAFVMGASAKPDKDTPYQTTIWLADTVTGSTRALTGTGTSESPCWSPDSDKIVFVSNSAHKEESQLYQISIAGGEAERLTDVRGRVHTPKWVGNRIAFLYSELGAEAAKRDPIVVDDNPAFDRLWLYENRSIRAVTPANAHIHEYTWSPDGTRCAVVASFHPNPYEGWYSAQLYTVAEGGDLVPLCTMPNQIGRPTWSPDGTQIAFVSGVLSDEGNVSGEVYVVDSKGGEARNLTTNIDFSITWIEWRFEGILYGGRQIDSTVLGWIDPQTGNTRLIDKGMYTINGVGPQNVAVAENGTFAAVRESFVEPPNVHLRSFDGSDWRQLTQFSVEGLPPLHVENKHWSHPDGTPVHGFLVYPPDYDPGKRYPLFLHVHGGPSWSYVPRYMSSWERIFAARGFLVLMPNPRGSWGRGHAYQSANVGDLGGGDWQDANAGVDALIAEGLVDPERLAVGGWSYGGYLTAWAVTQTDRFRCAIAGASITNYESNYGVVPNREWQTTMFGSNVYDDFDLHRSRSPIAFANRVKTPTLLVHGNEDIYAPPSQAVEFYTALRYYGVPAQLALYPREPHGFQERAHQLDLYQRMVDWVDRYVFAEG